MGIVLLTVLDCCHSGTGADLPYRFKFSEDDETAIQLIEAELAAQEEIESEEENDEDEDHVDDQMMTMTMMLMMLHMKKKMTREKKNKMKSQIDQMLEFLA